MGGRSSLPSASSVKTVRLPVTDGGPVYSAKQGETQTQTSRGGRTSTFLSDMLKSLTGSIGFLGR